MSIPIDNAPDQFPPETFALVAFCDDCGHSATVDRDRIPPGLPVQALPRRLRCSKCGSRNCSMRIVYTGAGGFHYQRTPVTPAG